MLDADEVIAFCKLELASFKRPREVVQVTELPKTATGKIQRFRLRLSPGMKFYTSDTCRSIDVEFTVDARDPYLEDLA